MEEIEHRTLKVNGINIHVAEKGQGPIILFLHGFPQLWYTWRHQILSLSSLGYRAVAPDLRGYGDTDAPDAIESYTVFHLVGDLIALLNVISPDQEEMVFVVGHDWGAYIAWFLCLFRPEKVKALVNLSVPFRLNFDPKLDLVTEARSTYGDDYYLCRFQEPGDIEAEFAEIGTEIMMRRIMSLRLHGPLFFPKVKPPGPPPEIPAALPSWLSEEDIKYFAGKFEKTGFAGPVNYYRNLRRNFELMAPWVGCQIKVPVKFVIGDEDLVYYMAGVKDYIHNGGFKKDVPLLEEVVVMEGVAHYIQQEKPEDINNHIFNFFQKFI